jgi:hypothetical protein
VLWPLHFVLSPCDPFGVMPTVGLDPDWVRSNLNGFGFGSAWRRRVADAVRFPDRDHGEDAEFVEGVVNAGFQVGYAADAEGLVLHVIHQNNISRAFPQYVLPDFMLGKYFPGYARPPATTDLPDFSWFDPIDRQQGSITRPGASSSNFR